MDDFRADEEALGSRRTSCVPVARLKGPSKGKLYKHCPEIKALVAISSLRKFIAKSYNSSLANLKFPGCPIIDVT